MIPKAPVKLLREDEAPLYAKWRKTKSQAIRDQFIMSVYGIIVKHAKRHLRSIPLEDRINAGVIGALRAFDKFDPTRGKRFSTYADSWIMAEMVALDRAHPIVTGTTKRYGEGAEKLNELRRAVKATSLEVLEEQGLELVDEEHDPEAIIDQADALDELATFISKADLTPDERWVIQNRWLSTRKDPISFRRLGELRGVSHELIRQIEARAFEKIRRMKEDGSSS